MKICIVYDDDELHCTCKYIHVCEIDVWIVLYTCRQQLKKRQNWFSFKILTGFLSCILLCVWTPWWKNPTAIQFSAIIILYKTKILRLCNQIIELLSPPPPPLHTHRNDELVFERRSKSQNKSELNFHYCLHVMMIMQGYTLYMQWTYIIGKRY